MDKNNKSSGLLISIVSTVIGGAILMLVEPIRDFIINCIINAAKFISNISLSSWTFLKNDHKINGFLIIITFGLSLLLVVLWIISFVRDNTNKVKNGYTSDEFYNVVWKWYWNGMKVSNLWCYCRNCDFELSYDDTSMHKYSHDQHPRTDLICDHCGRTVSSVPQYSKEYLLSVIEREIYRNLRIKQSSNSESKKKEI